MKPFNIMAILLLSACTGKEATQTDSASGVDDNPAPAQDTLPNAAAPNYPPADASGNLTGETRKNSGGMGQDAPPETIGRDSAFGPIGTMDSLGNRGPIRK